MSTKRKVPLFSVGLFLLAGLVILGYMIITYGATNKVQEGYRVDIEFDDASGIIEGGIVRMSGANVGYIVAPPTLNAHNKVMVPVMIRKDLTLPANTKFEIISLSLLGDKAIYIKIPEQEDTLKLKDGDSVIGHSPKGMGELQDSAKVVATQVSDLMDQANTSLAKFDLALEEYTKLATGLNESITRLNSSLLSEESITEVQLTLSNVKEATLNVKTASANFEALTKGLKPLGAEAQKTLEEFRTVAQSSDKTIKTLNTRIEDLEPSLQKLPDTIDTYNKIGANLKEALENEDGLLATLINNKDVSNDTKIFVKNLKNNGILGYKDDSNPEGDDPRGRYRGMRR